MVQKNYWITCVLGCCLLSSLQANETQELPKFSEWIESIPKKNTNQESPQELDLAIKENWLKEFDRLLAGEIKQYGIQSDIKKLVTHTPSHDIWDTEIIPRINQAITEAPKEGQLRLKLLKALLEGERDQFAAILNPPVEKKQGDDDQKIKSAVLKLFKNNQNEQYALEYIRRSFQEDYATLEEQITHFENQLEKDTDLNGSISIPPLALDKDEQRTQDLISRLIKFYKDNPESYISITSHKATREVLQKAFVKAYKKEPLKIPDDIISLIEDESLLLTLIKNEKVIGLYDSYDKENIVSHAFNIGLCSSNNELVRQAMTFLDEEESDWHFSINPHNKQEAKNAFQTLSKIIDETSNVSFWDDLIKLGIQAGFESQLEARLDQLAENTEISTANQALRLHKVAEYHISLDRVERGQELQDLVLAYILGNPEPAFAGSFTGIYNSALKLSAALSQSDRLNQQAKDLLVVIKANTSDDPEELSYTSAPLELLAKEGLYSVLLEFAGIDIQTIHKKKRYSSHDRLGKALISAYYQEQQYEQVLKVFEQYPYWNDVYASKITGENDTLALIDSLVQLDQKDKALALLQHHFKNGHFHGFDPLYSLALKHFPEKFEDLLATVEKLSPFQERPYIWRAQKALDNQQLDEAEALAKQAISMDPSDGEQGKDDRMRVYQVLSDILRAKGNEQDAEFFRKVVQAIRLGEESDTLYYAGLTKRALDQYNKSLTLFADAYCLQSRLAVYHEKLGELELAEKFYQRAFELMPGSFGRIESHCFGCEGAFRSNMARNAAERVFAKVIETEPDNPQAHYLMAYLEEARNQPEKAFLSYKKATTLDPDYYNAWKNITELDLAVDNARLESIEEAITNIFRLDPYSGHGRPDLDVIFNMKTALSILQGLPEKSDTSTELYILKASEQRIREEKEKLKEMHGHSYNDYTSTEYGSAGREDYLSSHTLYSSILQLFLKY